MTTAFMIVAEKGIPIEAKAFTKGQPLIPPALSEFQGVRQSIIEIAKP